jgi:hypothetical protein
VTQLELDRGSERQKLVEGKRIDDLFIEPFEVSVCLVRRCSKAPRARRSVAAARLAGFGQTLSLTRPDEISGFDVTPTVRRTLRLERQHGRRQRWLRRFRLI